MNIGSTPAISSNAACEAAIAINTGWFMPPTQPPGTDTPDPRTPPFHRGFGNSTATTRQQSPARQLPRSERPPASLDRLVQTFTSREGAHHVLDLIAGDGGDRRRQRLGQQAGRLHPWSVAAAEQLGWLGG